MGTKKCFECSMTEQQAIQVERFIKKQKGEDY